MTVESPVSVAFPDPLAVPELAKYLANVRKWHGYVRFIGLPHLGENPDVRCERLFVNPRLSEQRIPPDRDLVDWPDTVLLMEAIARHRRLVVLGDPGSGKSTMVNWLAWRFAQGGDNAWTRRFGPLVPLPMILRDLKLGSVFGWDGLLDAFLDREPAAPLAGSAGRDRLMEVLESGQALILLDGLDEIGSTIARAGVRYAFFEGARRYPSCRFVLTSRVVGYDELPFHEGTRSGALQQLLLGSAHIMPGQAYAENILPISLNLLREKIYSDENSLESLSVSDIQNIMNTTIESKVISKPSDFLKKGVPLLLRHIATGEAPEATAGLMYVAPFNNEQISAFAKRWYAEREAVSSRAAEQAESLIAAVHSHLAIEHLARVPNLLTIMALVNRVYARLPDGRALLYDRIAEAYLESIDQVRKLAAPDIPLRQKERWLARVGFEMQRRRAADAENTSPISDGAPNARDILVETEDVEGWILDAMADAGRPRDEREARDFVDHVARRSGLLIPRGEGLFAFAHLSFQEYFAAKHLAAGVTAPPRKRKTAPLVGTADDELLSYADRKTWRESLVFLFESLADTEGWIDELLEVLFGRGLESVSEASATVQSLAFALIADTHSGLTPEHRETLRERLTDLALDGGALDQLGRIGNLPNLRQLRLSGAGVPDLGPLSGLTALQNLALIGTGVPDLSPLSSLTGLQTLFLVGTGVPDLGPLSSLTGLQSLMLIGTAVSDLGPLSGLNGLQFLALSATAVSDLGPLSSLTGLQSLLLIGAAVSDLGPLSGLNGLQFLALSGTAVSDLGPLSSLTGLQTLSLDGTAVSDLGPLSGLTGLSSLSLNGTAVSDLGPLSGLTGLQILSLVGTGVSDLSPLSGLTELRELTLGATETTDITPLTGLDKLRITRSGTFSDDTEPGA